MKIIQSVQAWTMYRQDIMHDVSVGFVPTMGNLHEGHLTLLKRSIAENDKTFLSIFVNPTQFNNAADLENYPKTFERDCALAKDLGVDAVLAPSYEDLYPDNYRYRVNEVDLSGILEGLHRPGHFEGMLTIVLKLLLLVKAKRAYFGEKDYQQMQLVQGLVKAFFVNTEIVPCPTIRNDFGLPLSSRNSRLSPDALEKTKVFAAQLQSSASPSDIERALKKAGFKVEYIEDHNNRRFAAVQIGDVRLIDNVAMEELC